MEFVLYDVFRPNVLCDCDHRSLCICYDLVRFVVNIAVAPVVTVIVVIVSVVSLCCGKYEQG